MKIRNSNFSKQIFIKHMNSIAALDSGIIDEVERDLGERIVDIISDPANWIAEALMNGVIAIAGVAGFNWIKNKLRDFFGCLGGITNTSIIKVLKDFFRSLPGLMGILPDLNDPSSIGQITRKTEEINTRVDEINRKIKQIDPSWNEHCLKDGTNEMYKKSIEGKYRNYPDDYGSNSYSHITDFISEVISGAITLDNYTTSLASAAISSGAYASAADTIIFMLRVDYLANLSDTELVAASVAIAALIAALAVITGISAGIASAVSAAMATFLSTISAIGGLSAAAQQQILQTMRQLFPQLQQYITT